MHSEMAPLPYDACTGKGPTVISAGLRPAAPHHGQWCSRHGKVSKFLKKLEVELLLWKSHFWVYTQKNVKQDPGEVFARPCYHSVIRGCQGVEATQIFIN